LRDRALRTAALETVTKLLCAALALPTCVSGQTASSSGDKGVAQDSLSQVAAQLFGQPTVRISLPTYAPDLVVVQPHLIGDTLEFAGYAPGAWTLDTATVPHQILLTGITRLQVRSSAWDRGALIGLLMGASAAGAAHAAGRFHIDRGDALFAGLLSGTSGALLGGVIGALFHQWTTVYETPQ
jgi:hypothetical protein